MRTRLFLLLVLQLLLPQSVPAVEPVPGGSGALPIIGGEPSAAGGQPWIVALVRNTPESRPIESRHFCGGTLIAPTWVITAAHCIVGADPRNFHLLVGREALAGNDGEELVAAELIVHPFYDPATVRNDVALIRLARPAAATPLRLATAADDEVMGGASATVYGWGFGSYRENYNCRVNFIDSGASFRDYFCETKVYSYGAKGARLDEGRLRLASHAECDVRYREYLISRGVQQPLPEEPYFSEELTPEVLCAWDPAELQSPCFGDSGGPLVGTVNGGPVLAGVVSFSYRGECATAVQVGVFARVSAYAAFIAESMGRDQSLGFAALCPRRPELHIEFTSLSADSSRVAITWEADSAATGWRLYYTPANAPGATPGVIDLPADASDYATRLRTGQSFYLALRARGAACDGELSLLKRIAVP